MYHEFKSVWFNEEGDTIGILSSEGPTTLGIFEGEYKGTFFKALACEVELKADDWTKIGKF
jgi:hypothetical protein